MKRILLSLFVFVILSSISYSKPQAELNIRLDSVQVGVLKKPLFGVFIEYLKKRVNGKFGVSAQELEDRGFDCQKYGMDWELYQYWQLHNTGSPDSIIEDKPWYTGFNKRGMRHYQIKRTAVNGECGYSQDVILDSGKTFDFYVYVKGTTDSVFLRLTSIDDGTILMDKSLGSIPQNWEKRTAVVPPLNKQTNVQVLIYTKNVGEINFDESSLMSRDNKYTLRKEFFQLMKELNPKLLRFPGGCYADYFTWHFESSIGDYDQRISPNYWNDATIMRMEFSLDEYFAFCEELDIEPYITVNYSDGTVQEAVNLLEYCNGSSDTKYGKMRAQNGHPAPYNVTYFEIGNEQWEMFDPNYPTNYLNYYKAMKEYDPKIKILVNGFNWDGLKEIQRVFGVVKDKADFYSWHPAYYVSPDQNLSPEEEYWGMVSGSVMTQYDLSNTMEWLKEYSGPNTKHAPTEYWTQFANLDTWLLDSTFRSRSLEAALGDLNFLHTFIRNWNTTGPACRTIFLGFYKEDPTPEGGRVYYGTAGYHAFKMLFNHVGMDFVPSTYSGDLISFDNFQTMNFIKNLPLLDVVVSKNSDSLYICVINRHISDSVATQLKIPFWKNQQKVKIYELYSPNYLDNNSAENPNFVIPKEKDTLISSVYNFPPHSYTILAIPLSDSSNILPPKPDESPDYSIFPNPASEEILFDAFGEAIDYLHISDMNGRKIYEMGSNSKGFVVINISELTVGSYILNASIKGKEVHWKFIKK